MSDMRQMLSARPTPVPRRIVAVPQRAQNVAGQPSYWAAVNRHLALPNRFAAAVASRALTNRTAFQDELLATGRVTEERYFAALAAALSIEFRDTINPEALVMKDRDAVLAFRSIGGPRLVRLDDGSGTALIAIAPRDADIGRLAARLRDEPALAGRLLIVTPSAMRRAVIARGRSLLLHRSRNRLFDALPYCSARLVMTGTQGFAIGTLLVLALAMVVVLPGPSVLAMHIFFSVFFLSCVVLRLLAVRRLPVPEPQPIERFDPATMPRYAVLVALYREAEIVPELLVALGRLQWPRGKLEIKLVCEVDDLETIKAIRAHGPRPCVEIVEVPKSLPRTKPKALAYALQLVSSDFVALYDAEDRPHPAQLIEAWQRFRRSRPDLACVQAPLIISNGGRSLIARMFAFEYSGLFRAMLPFLSRNELILPLGGTSNHFRRSVLEKIGGWDPFNVTEDADLGLRMRRFGYRTETITLPTQESAPETLADWIPQRTRWFKGWIQTWLVHMREPRRLVRELGPVSFIVSQILFAGMVVSALAHPLLLVTLGVIAFDVLRGGEISSFQSALMGIDLANIVLGYGAFILLGRSTLPPRERRYMPVVIACTPVYWVMLSVAAWRSVWQLAREPHLCGLMYQRHQALDA